MIKRLMLLFALMAATAGIVMAMTANAADHRDSPSVENDPAADIADVYAFRSPATIFFNRVAFALADSRDMPSKGMSHFQFRKPRCQFRSMGNRSQRPPAKPEA